jgi:hypothetical protein
LFAFTALLALFALSATGGVFAGGAVVVELFVVVVVVVVVVGVVFVAFVLSAVVQPSHRLVNANTANRAKVRRIADPPVAPQGLV